MMITAEQIKSIINQKLDNEGIVLVDLSVDSRNRIKVIVDTIEGITIDKCVEISRVIENNFNRDVEDYELEVTSPGIDRPLTIPFQFIKNTGRQLEIITHTGLSVKGVLQYADQQKIEVEIKIRKVTGNSKKKEFELKKTVLEYKEIKLAKVILTF